MSKPAKTDQPESFEAALAELEKIVASMESGKLTLEQSLAAHKRGLELAQYCQGVLARAQQQVKVLRKHAEKLPRCRRRRVISPPGWRESRLGSKRRSSVFSRPQE